MNPEPTRSGNLRAPTRTAAASGVARSVHAAMAVLAAWGLMACTHPPAVPDPALGLAARVASFPASGVVMLGEQHDAAQHQQIQAEVGLQLARQKRLAAVVLEMAEAGRSTAGLATDAGEGDVRAALGWDENAWPWSAYGPGIMQAVRQGVEVVGGNLPRARMRATMTDRTLDERLQADEWAVQEQRMRDGHCNLLPASQIRPMARIQTARDISLAEVTASKLQPDQIVLVWVGSEHADRRIGVPRYLRLPPGYALLTIRLLAGGGTSPDDRFDRIWSTAAVPARDHCAELRQMLEQRPAPAGTAPAPP